MHPLQISFWGLSDSTCCVVMIEDTTAPSYWLNWRFLLCAIWIFVAMVSSALLIWRYEGYKNSQNQPNEHEAAACLYEDQIWGTCSKSINPLWLLAYRIIAFGALFALLIADIIIHGVVKYYFYTEWTFTLVTVYFGLASSLSIRACLSYYDQVAARRDCCVGTDTESGSYVPPSLEENADIPSNTGSSNQHGEHSCRSVASVWVYALQIVFQMCAGAVALTDSVFWLLIYPFLVTNDYRLNFLIVCKHSVNAVLLLGDTTLNSLGFPFFRIAYFVLWTSIFIIFQWIFHAFVSIRWPYPFVDLSSQYAPLWYLAVGLMLSPCFGIYTLIFWIKRCFLSRLTSDAINAFETTSN